MSARPYKGRGRGQAEGERKPDSSEAKVDGFILHLKPVEPDRLRRTPIARLRGALKHLLRSWGLRAIRIQSAKGDDL